MGFNNLVNPNKDIDGFIEKTKGYSYIKRALWWFQLNLGKIVTSAEFAKIPGKKGQILSHNIRRVFELRDEYGYEIANHKDNEKTGFNLKVDEYVLLSKEPNPEKIRARGVNKRIRFDVFERDGYQCQICGRVAGEDDPYKPDHKIKLHVGHIQAHKNRKGEITKKRQLDINDFITMCNICNEGAKNKNIKIIRLVDRITNASIDEKKEIYAYLKNYFKE